MTNENKLDSRKNLESPAKNIIPQNNKKVNSIFGYDYEDLKRVITLHGTDVFGSNISVKNFLKIICKTFKLKNEITKINGNKMIKYYKFNPEKNIYQDYNLSDLGEDINLISTFLHHKGLDVKTLQDKCYVELKTSYHPLLGIDPINLPPKELIKFNNGIANLKTKEFYSKESSDYKNLIKKYDFINSYDFNYLETLTDDNQYILVYNKLIKDLSDNKDDQILLFNQLVFSVIEGNGRGKYIMLSGQAGSGKTTFGNVLLNIAGEDYTNYLTLDMMDDDNSINTLNLSTKLILGDDLQKSAKLVGKSLRYFKTLVDGNKLSVAVKYEPNRIVQTRGLWLQMMNDDPSIYEANDAIKDRTVLVKITGRNHRTVVDPGEKEFSRRLDNYTGKFGKADENFIQAVVSYIVQHVEYFEEFTISEEMRKATEDMVDDANWAYQFTEYLDENELFEFDELPFCDINEIFTYWLSEYNSSMKKPAARNILKELITYFELKGYKLSDKQIRISNKNAIKYNREIIKEIFPDIKYRLNNPKSKIWKKNESSISREDVKLIEDLFDNNVINKDYDNFNMKEKIIINALKESGNINIMTWLVQFKTEN